MQAVSARILPYITKRCGHLKLSAFWGACSSSGCYSIPSVHSSLTKQQQCHHSQQVLSQGKCIHLTLNSAQALLYTSSAHFSKVHNDSELKSILKEIAEDFGDDKEKDNSEEKTGDVDLGNKNSEFTFEAQNSETETTERSAVTDGNTEQVNIDEELLRYDYEEFELMEEEDEEPEYEEEEVYPISLTRGRTGVYDIEDLVELLRSENARDLCVISVPAEIKFVDYMVIVTGRSPRHLHAMALYAKKLYKLRRGKKDPPTSHIEGDPSSKWLAMDLGNIILHLFTSDVREIYDLETLWTVGPKYDPLCKEPKDVPDISWVDGFMADFKQFEAAATRKPRESMDSLTDWHKT